MAGASFLVEFDATIYCTVAAVACLLSISMPVMFFSTLFSFSFSIHFLKFSLTFYIDFFF